MRFQVQREVSSATGTGNITRARRDTEKKSREFLHARGLHNNIIKLGVPLSARKELPDNLGPQNDSQMNDNRKGTVVFGGCWGALRCCTGLCVRACVRPQKSVRPPYIREIVFFRSPQTAVPSCSLENENVQNSGSPPCLRD